MPMGTMKIYIEQFYRQARQYLFSVREIFIWQIVHVRQVLKGSPHKIRRIVAWTLEIQLTSTIKHEQSQRPLYPEIIK